MVYVTSLIRSYPAAMGERGESFSREVLAGRPFGWPVVEDVPMEHRNIDHVAVSPRAVLAIETKCSVPGASGRRTVTGHGDGECAVELPSVRSILRSQGVKEAPVEPVLMLWGPGAARLEADWAILEGVHLVRGVAAGDEWRLQCSSGEISPSQATTIVGILRSHQARRDGHVSTR